MPPACPAATRRRRSARRSRGSPGRERGWRPRPRRWRQAAPRRSRRSCRCRGLTSLRRRAPPGAGAAVRATEYAGRVILSERSMTRCACRAALRRWVRRVAVPGADGAWPAPSRARPALLRARSRDVAAVPMGKLFGRRRRCAFRWNPGLRPAELSRAVVLHELAHLAVLDHSKRVLAKACGARPRLPRTPGGPRARPRPDPRMGAAGRERYPGPQGRAPAVVAGEACLRAEGSTPMSRTERDEATSTIPTSVAPMRLRQRQ